ncbi:MAG: DUF1972 domain-containing protein [Planctomycetota bacterium]
MPKSFRSIAPSQTRAPRLAILGSRGIPARYGGFETFVEEISKRLVARGADVTVFCEKERRARRLPKRFGRVALEHIPTWAPGPLRSLQYDRASWKQAQKARQPFDVVYMLGYGSACFFDPPRKRRGPKLWINMDGLEWRRSKWSGLARRWLAKMEERATKAADLLVFDNEAVREDVLSRWGRGGRFGARTDSTVLAYGAPLAPLVASMEHLAHRGLQPGGYDLVVCRSEPENHLLEIARAHAASSAKVPLVVVANTHRGTDYDRRCLALDGENVRFLGTVWDSGELLALRRGARAYLHGHSVGGTNPSLLEAMVCGAPTIAHDNPFNREVLGADAFWFRTEAELSRRLDEFEAYPPSRRMEIGRLARKRAIENYDWEEIADRYFDLLCEAAGVVHPADRAEARDRLAERRSA